MHLEDDSIVVLNCTVMFGNRSVGAIRLRQGRGEKDRSREGTRKVIAQSKLLAPWQQVIDAIRI